VEVGVWKFISLENHYWKVVSGEKRRIRKHGLLGGKLLFPLLCFPSWVWLFIQQTHPTKDHSSIYVFSLGTTFYCVLDQFFSIIFFFVFLKVK